MSGGANLSTQISKYYKSFSGTDTLAFIIMPGCGPVVIGSLTTISYSMYRNKKPVINIGRTNINGVTRGSRIFAGTMIFTLINQHWLKELQQQGCTWLSEYGYTNENGEWLPDGSYDLKVDDLPLFDIMIVSANEYGNAVSMYIYGIDFTDEAQTISVEDLFTENTFSFVARDISNFKAGAIHGAQVQKGGFSSNKANDFVQKFFVLDSSITGLDDLIDLEKELITAKVKQLELPQIPSLVRDLYYSAANAIIGNDVAEIQELLNKTNLVDIPISGIFDSITDAAVRKFQSFIKETVDGIVNSKIYNALINYVPKDGVRMGVVVNKFGAYVYKDPNYSSDIVDVKRYQEQVPVHSFVTSEEHGSSHGRSLVSEEQPFHRWYKTPTGYIAEEDLYSSYYTGSVVEFPTVKYGDSSAYVTIIQSALSNIYPEYAGVTGTYDITTQMQIERLQDENGIVPSGNVDNDTWLLLQSLSGNVANKVSDDNFKIEFGTLPGIYNVSKKHVIDQLSIFTASVSCSNYINVKISAISFYKDGESETVTKTILLKNRVAIKLSDLKKAFIYHPKHGEPTQVDFIIYPYNKKPYKWTIMYS